MCVCVCVLVTWQSKIKLHPASWQLQLSGTLTVCPLRCKHLLCDEAPASCNINVSNDDLDMCSTPHNHKKSRTSSKAKPSARSASLGGLRAAIIQNQKTGTHRFLNIQNYTIVLPNPWFFITFVQPAFPDHWLAFPGHWFLPFWPFSRTSANCASGCKCRSQGHPVTDFVAVNQKRMQWTTGIHTEWISGSSQSSDGWRLTLGLRLQC